MTEIVIASRDLRRPYNFDTLADIVPTETPRLPKRINGDLAVTFDAVLDPAQVAAIQLRLTTRDDAEAAAKTALEGAAQEALAYDPPTLPAGSAAARTATQKTTRTTTPAATDADRDAVITALTAQVTWLTEKYAELVQFVLDQNRGA